MEGELSPGPIDEAGKVATSVVDALKAQPLALTMLIMNIMLVALLTYVAWVGAHTREREVNLIYQSQTKVQELLARCFLPPQTQQSGRNYRVQSDEEKPVQLPPETTPRGPHE